MDDLKLFSKTVKQMDTLMNSVCIFGEDIRTEFGISKCGILVMTKRKYVYSEGTEIPTSEKLKEIDVEKGYKYRSILEDESVKDKKRKENIKVEYTKRLKKVLKPKLNGKNIIHTINSPSLGTV